MASTSQIDCEIGEGSSNTEVLEEQLPQCSTRRRKNPVPVKINPSKVQQFIEVSQISIIQNKKVFEIKSLSMIPIEFKVTNIFAIDSNKETPVKLVKLEDEIMQSDSDIKKEDDKKTKLIDDLPPEMLQAVLQILSSSDLINLRLINRKFNEIASQIMRQRSDITLHFSLDHGRYMRNTHHRHCEELLVNICKTYSRTSSKSLDDLVLCLKNAKHFPITSFKWDTPDQLGFENEDMKSFLSIWGKNIFALDIKLNENSGEILRNLLVEKVPNLKELQICFKWIKDVSSTEVFPDSNEFRLPKLQVLAVDGYRKQFRTMIGNILQGACNLNNFFHVARDESEPQETCAEDSITVDELAMLESYNKLHCLKNVQIEFSEEFIAFWKNSQKIGDVKLESLAVSFSASVSQNEKLKAIATTIVNQLFQSSANALQTLAIEPLGSSTEIFIPKMKNLNKLDLWGYPQADEAPTMYAMFPPFFEIADNFPNLKELGVHLHRNDGIIFPKSQPLKPLTGVTTLQIEGDVSKETTRILMKAAPNVTTLLIKDTEESFDDENVNLNFAAIANYLPKLQSFGWFIVRSSHRNLLHSLDAAITGFSVEFCKQNSEKFRNKTDLTANELDFYQSQPRNPSILDLKELKQFDVSFLMDSDADDEDDETGFDRDNIFFRTGFSKVSKLLAFDLMPNLKIRTHRYLN